MNNKNNNAKNNLFIVSNHGYLYKIVYKIVCNLVK